jgi:hypothetical protein
MTGLMFPTHTLRFSSSLAMIQGLKKLFREGLRPKNILFVALDENGDAHVVLPERLKDVDNLKVGHKLSLPWPNDENLFYIDAVHPIGREVAVLNGDRRLGKFASMVDVVALVSWFVKEAKTESVFFGCTPHQPGSWWVSGEKTIAQHTRGFVEIVPTLQGLLARRTMDNGLYFLPAEAAVTGGIEHWQKIFESPLGNILMLDRRLLHDQLVWSCQEGLVELDVYDLPKVSESGRCRLKGGFAVVGRITGGAFAVARGKPMDWGFDELKPATLVGSEGCTFAELRKFLLEMQAEEPL